MSELELYLIVGLGNPGKAYERTRHNMGFLAIQELANRHGLAFQKQMQFRSSLAQGVIHSKRVLLQMPHTYMNLSGEAVSSTLRFWKIPVERLLVLVDDVALDLGWLRLKENSGSGGHNGLKSIEEQVQTQRYARLRIGVGDRQEGDLADHVLGRFSEDEEKKIPSILQRAAEAVEIWLEKDMASAMNMVNRNDSL